MVPIDSQRQSRHDGAMSAILAQPPAELPPTLAAFVAMPTAPAIKRLNYSHDAMIDQIVANPWINQGQLARIFGYTEGWVSQVLATDAFQARLAARKNEIVDPTLRATIEERFKGLVLQSLEVLRRKLEKTEVTDDLALRSVEIAAKALGYGAKGPLIQNNNSFVVQLPGKAASSGEWEKAYSREGAVTVDHQASPSAAVPSGATTLPPFDPTAPAMLVALAENPPAVATPYPQPSAEMAEGLLKGLVGA